MSSLDPNVIWVALIVFAGTALSALVSFRAPIVLFRMTAAQRSAERKEDQDERNSVRKQVEEAARLQKAQNEKVATSTAATNDKLDEIHVAVNSNLMKSQIEALEAKEMLVIVMAQMVQNIRDKGDVPPDDTLEYIKKTQKRAMELRSQLYPQTARS